MALGDAYATLDEFKSRSGISDSLDDTEIQAVLDTCSRWIDGYCDRQFNSGAATRTYPVTSYSLLDVDDLVSITTLKTDSAGDGTFETTWATTDYQLLVHQKPLGESYWPYTRIRALATLSFPTGYDPMGRADRVEIVGTFGWTSVPPDVKQACLIMATDMLKLSGMAFGVAGYGEYGAVRARPNPIVAALLSRYRKYPVLVG